MFWREKTYEVLPALSVRGSHLRSSLRLITIAWMWGVVWATAISGDQLMKFCTMLGFNNLAFGLLSAIPCLASLGQIIAAVMVERTGLRKYFWFYTVLTSRILWAAFAGLPFLFWPNGHGTAAGVVLALVIVGLCNFLANVATPPWWTWMGDLIPRRIRGRYFALRMKLTTIIQIVVVIVISLVLRHIGWGGPEHSSADENRTVLYAICIIFGIGAVFGCIDILTFMGVREVFPDRMPNEKPSFDFTVPKPSRWSVPGAVSYAARFTGKVAWETLLDPLRDRVFRNYVCYSAIIMFSMTCCGWFYWLFASKTLGFDALQTNLVFMAIGPVAGTLSSPWWGKMIDRWGRRPTLIVSTLLMGMAVIPWFFLSHDMYCPQFVADGINAVGAAVGWIIQRPDWVWVTPEGRWHIMPYVLASFGCILGNASGTAFGLAQSAIVLGFSDGKGRNKYVAASSVLINVGGTLGGVAGGLVAQKFDSVQICVGAFAWNSYQFTFLMGMVLRFVALGWLWNMPDPGARKVRDMFRLWSVNIYNAMSSRLSEPLRLFGWGKSRSTHGDSGDRDQGPSDNGKEH